MKDLVSYVNIKSKKLQYLVSVLNLSIYFDKNNKTLVILCKQL